MNKKTFLIKILPVIITFVLVFTVILAVTSCTQSKKVPYGSINSDPYASITLSDGTYTISKKDLYNQLRYVGDDTLFFEVHKMIYAEEIAKINADMPTYEQKFKDAINMEVYATDDQEKIDELTTDEKNLALLKYYDKLYQSGNTGVVYNAEPYQQIIYDYYILQIAQEMYAYDLLVEATADITNKDNPNRITDTVFQEKYDNLREFNDDISALIIRFNSTADATESLKELHIKFVKNKLYRVPEVLGEDYNTTYTNFSTSGKSELNDTEVLFEYIRLYNYIYSYRGVDSLFKIRDEFNVYDIDLGIGDGLADPTRTIERTYINGLPLSNLIAEITLQTTNPIPAFDANNKINFDYIDFKDTKVRDHVYTTLSLNDTSKQKYSTSTQTATIGCFISFKLEDATNIKYNSLEDLANYVTENNKSTPDPVKLAAYFNSLKSDFVNDIIGMNDVEVKAYLLALAATVDAVNTKANEWSQTNQDSVWNAIVNDFFTGEYVSKTTNERIAEATITVYDPLLELLFRVSDPEFKKSSKKSPDGNAVASIKYNDVTTYINVDGENGLYALLEKKFGAPISFQMAYKEILKDKYYDQISKKDHERYEEEFQNHLSYFQQGSFESNGLPASFGKNDFIRAYFKSETVEEAIFNSWVLGALDEIYVKDNMDIAFPGIYDTFSSMATKAYENYFSMTYGDLRIYTDDNEDGIADAATEYTPARKTAVENAVVSLISKMYSEFSRPSYDKSKGFTTLVSSYNDSSRINMYAGIPMDTFLTESEKSAYLWSDYKKLGIFVEYKADKNAARSLVTETAFDDITLQNQIYNFYNYAKDMIAADTFSSTFVACELAKIAEGSPLDVVIPATLLSTTDGYHALYFSDSTLASSAKFLPTDNPMDGTTKLYPYDLREGNPRPWHMSGEQIILDEYVVEGGVNVYPTTTLYNQTNIPTANQIALYIREHNSEAGVLSFSSSVQSALEAFAAPFYTEYYLAKDFDQVLLYHLVMSNGFAHVDPIKGTQLGKLVVINNNNLFKYTESDIKNIWWAYFDFSE